MKQVKNLRAGEIFTYNNIEFIALGEEQNGLLAIKAEPLKGISFDEHNRNDWRTSSLRKYLNGEYLKKFFDSNVLISFISDLTSDDGMLDYGISYDKIFLLSADLYRKYRYWIPTRKIYTWLITPYTCLKEYASMVRLVNPVGALDNGDAYYSNNKTIPACIFNLNLYIEDPSEQVDLEIKKLRNDITLQENTLMSLNSKMEQLKVERDKLKQRIIN